MTAVPLSDGDQLVASRDPEVSSKRLELAMILVGAVLVLIAVIAWI